MELMVAVAILAILILIFGVAISSSQRLVSTSQTQMRATATVNAIAETIRRDIRNCSSKGFLAITVSGQSTPALVFTTAGPAASLTCANANRKVDEPLALTGSGSVVAYGACPDDNGEFTMFRASWVLQSDNTKYPTGVTIPGPTADVMPYDLSQLLVFTRSQFNDSILDQRVLSGDGVYAPIFLRSVPRTLDDMSILWKFLVGRCRALSIQWSDGTKDANNNVRWYGPIWQVEDDGAGNNLTPRLFYPTQGVGWGGKDYADNGQSYTYMHVGCGSAPAGKGSLGSVETYTEYQASGGYRALWTNKDVLSSTVYAWPKAIKIRFELNEPSMPKEVCNTAYEVICTISP